MKTCRMCEMVEKHFAQRGSLNFRGIYGFLIAVEIFRICNWIMLLRVLRIWLTKYIIIFLTTMYCWFSNITMGWIILANVEQEWSEWRDKLRLKASRSDMLCVATYRNIKRNNYRNVQHRTFALIMHRFSIHRIPKRNPGCDLNLINYYNSKDINLYPK